MCLCILENNLLSNWLLVLLLFLQPLLLFFQFQKEQANLAFISAIRLPCPSVLPALDSEANRLMACLRAGETKQSIPNPMALHVPKSQVTHKLTFLEAFCDTVFMVWQLCCKVHSLPLRETGLSALALQMCKCIWQCVYVSGICYFLGVLRFSAGTAAK